MDVQLIHITRGFCVYTHKNQSNSPGVLRRSKPVFQPALFAFGAVMGSDTPSFNEQQILDLLDENNGNVGLVANECGMTPRWVQDVKARFWQPLVPEITALVEAPAQTALATIPDEDVVPMLPPDITRVEKLRTETLDYLTEAIQTREVHGKDAIKLLETLLMYENSLRASMAPNYNIFNDNRKQTIQVGQLAEALRNKLSIEQLRLAAGVAAPIEIIEGTVVPVGDTDDATQS